MDLSKAKDRIESLSKAKQVFTEIDENPNEIAIKLSIEITKIISKKLSKMPAINPIHEGGILMEWSWLGENKCEYRYFSIEATNEGNLYCLKRNGDKMLANDFRKTEDLICYFNDEIINEFNL